MQDQQFRHGNRTTGKGGSLAEAVDVVQFGEVWRVSIECLNLGVVVMRHGAATWGRLSIAGGNSHSYDARLLWLVAVRPASGRYRIMAGRDRGRY